MGGGHGCGGPVLSRTEKGQQPDLHDHQGGLSKGTIQSIEGQGGIGQGKIIGLRQGHDAPDSGSFIDLLYLNEGHAGVHRIKAAHFYTSTMARLAKKLPSNIRVKIALARESLETKI